VVGCGDAGQEPAFAKAGVGELVLPAIERNGPIEARIIETLQQRLERES
jgi:hypothetical protein